MAEPGGIVLSAAAHEQVKKILPLAYTALGEQKTALRVASVPAEKFEASVEADNPATVTKLAAGKHYLIEQENSSY